MCVKLEPSSLSFVCFTDAYVAHVHICVQFVEIIFSSSLSAPIITFLNTISENRCFVAERAYSQGMNIL